MLRIYFHSADITKISPVCLPVLNPYHVFISVKLCNQSYISYKTKNKIITGNVMLLGQKVVLFVNNCKLPPKGRRFTGVADDAKSALNAVGLKLFHRAI
jgi:hypothetical protein